ncbi:glycoside hydrolase superfamily [Mycena vitilis]|nr:glycoside hydrolase superfamily [Mycena vitilis]
MQFLPTATSGTTAPPESSSQRVPRLWNLTKKIQYQHREVYNSAPYSDLQHGLHPEKWEQSTWMALACQLDADSAFLTSKHHDGYCLWPTSTSECHTSVTAKPCKFGLYYSWWWWEFRHQVDQGTRNGEAYLRRMVAQVKELHDATQSTPSTKPSLTSFLGRRMSISPTAQARRRSWAVYK